MLAAIKDKATDPAKVKVFENDILSQAIQPLSSFELNLIAKQYYKLKTRDYSDSTSFLKVEIISRTLRELIMNDLRDR